MKLPADFAMAPAFAIAVILARDFGVVGLPLVILLGIGISALARRNAAHTLGLVLASLLFLIPLAHVPPLDGPSFAGVLGVDVIGRDILQRILVGHAESVWVALLAAGVATIVSLAVAVTLEFAPAWIRGPLGIGHRAFLVFPSLLLILIVLTASERRGAILGLIIGAMIWGEPARMLCAELRELRLAPFVVAGQLRGERGLALVSREFLPNLWAVMTANTLVCFSTAMLLQAVLGYLGLDHSGLGQLLDEGVRRMDLEPQTLIATLALLMAWLVCLRMLLRRFWHRGKLDTVMH